MIIRQCRQIYEVKTRPQITGSIEGSVQSVHIHSDQTRDLTVYNKKIVNQLFPMSTNIHNLQAVTPFYGLIRASIEYCYIFC